MGTRMFTGALSATLIFLVIACGDVFASGGLTTIPGDQVTIEHGDNPNGVGGVDAACLQPNNNSGAPAPSANTTTSRSRGRLANGRSSRPQP